MSKLGCSCPRCYVYHTQVIKGGHIHNMKLKDQVASLELAKCLKQLGVDQKVKHGDFIYIDDELHLVHDDLDTSYLVGNDYSIQFSRDSGALIDRCRHCIDDVFKTFTVAELGEMIRQYTDFMPRQVGKETEADVRARMLIELMLNED